MSEPGAGGHGRNRVAVKPGQAFVVALLRAYRWLISPAKNFLVGQSGTCRFTPTCSAYALEAVQRHGTFTGCRLAARRLCRCHPWGGSGLDPVPESTAIVPISPTWTEKA